MTIKLLLPILTGGLLLGCVDEYGRVRPPDPIGQAIFNALDPGSSLPVAGIRCCERYADCAV